MAQGLRPDTIRPMHVSATRYRRPGILLLISLVILLPAHASDPDYLSYERPVEKSVLESEGSFADISAKEDEQPGFRDRITRVKNFLWDDASLRLQPRSYYFDRNRDGQADSQAWALGGNVKYDTGWYRDRLQLSASLFTSQKLYGPSDKDGTLLLKPGQNGYTVLGESYLTARLTGKSMARLYRQDISLPYVNRQDNRMTRNTFEAYLLIDADSPQLNYVAGHISQMKRRNETDFISMSEAAGSSDTDRGLSMAGMRYRFSKHIDIGAINYHGRDVMNVFYTEGNAAWNLGNDFALRLSGQYTDQRSIGNESIGNFDTHALGGKVAVSYRHAILSLAFSTIGNDTGIKNPWGGYPGYLSLVNKDFDRAGEDAWLIGLSYDFTRLGLPELSAFANYANGDTPDNGSNASPDQQEFDLTIDYRFTGVMNGLWVRARTAYVDQDGGLDSQDYRLIVNYSVPLK